MAASVFVTEGRQMQKPIEKCTAVILVRETDAPDLVIGRSLFAEEEGARGALLDWVEGEVLGGACVPA